MVVTDEGRLLSTTFVIIFYMLPLFFVPVFVFHTFSTFVALIEHLGLPLKFSLFT